MPASTYDLIGQIINPSPAPHVPAQPPTTAISNEPVHVLIGRILAPPPVSGSWVRP